MRCGNNGEGMNKEETASHRQVATASHKLGSAMRELSEHGVQTIFLNVFTEKHVMEDSPHRFGLSLNREKT